MTARPLGCVLIAALCATFASGSRSQEPDDLLPFLAQGNPPTESLPPNPRPRQPSGQELPLHPTRHIAFETHEGTWMSVDQSPDGKRLVFDLLGDLYTMDAAGGAATRISHGLPFDTQPTYSPDGQWIAFVSDRSGAENVWIVRPDGSDSRQISF